MRAVLSEVMVDSDLIFDIIKLGYRGKKFPLVEAFWIAWIQALGKI